MSTDISSTFSAGTAHAPEMMSRAVAYAETIRLVPPGEGQSIVEAFRGALAELNRLGIGRRMGPLNASATVEGFEKTAEAILSALENSPLPEAEWAPMSEILSDELTGLLDISPSSVARYRSGERATPDPVAARLHVLAMIVSDLAGSYNDFGIRRWFRRPRTTLGGRAPEEILSGNWGPDAEDVIRVRNLAHSLMGAAGG